MVSWCEWMEDESSELEIEGFSRMSPTSSEQMLDPQASTSTEPLKLATLANTPNTHIQRIHAHMHTLKHVCTYAQQSTEPFLSHCIV